MAETVRLFMDDGTGSEYDALMAEARRDGLPDGGDLQVVTKDGGMESGAAIVMLTFTVATKLDASGQAVETKRVQTCTSVKNLLMALGALVGRYPEQNDRSWPTEPLGTILKGEHRGMTWEAKLMEKFYIVGVRGVPGGVSIAGDEASAKGCGEGMVNDFLSRR